MPYSPHELKSPENRPNSRPRLTLASPPSGAGSILNAALSQISIRSESQGNQAHHAQEVSSLAVLVPCTFCAGQSELTTPVGVTQSAPTEAQAPAAGPGQDLQPGRLGPAPIQLSIRTPGKTGRSLVETQPPVPNHTAGLPDLSPSVPSLNSYAEDATGRRLPVYGRQLFDEVPTTFAPVRMFLFRPTMC